MVRTMDLT